MLILHRAASEFDMIMRYEGCRAAETQNFDRKKQASTHKTDSIADYAIYEIKTNLVSNLLFSQNLKIIIGKQIRNGYYCQI